MDESQLRKEGCYNTFESKDNISLEIPGCSCVWEIKPELKITHGLCRHLPQLSKSSWKRRKCILSSAEPATVVSLEGKITDHETYMKYDSIDENKDKMYTYLDFSKM